MLHIIQFTFTLASHNRISCYRSATIQLTIVLYTVQ